MAGRSLLPLALVAWGCGGSEDYRVSSAADDHPVYEAHWTDEPVDVDGSLDDEAWRAAEPTADFIDIRGEGWPVPPSRTRAWMTWDEDALYVAAEIEEPHLWATLAERDQIVWRDDDFEIFLDPDGDGLNYFEIEINALGTVLDLFLARPYDQGGSARIDWDLEGLESAVSLRGTLNDPSDEDEGWTVEMAIPWAGLVPPPDTSAGVGEAVAPGAPQPMDEWRVNFSRVDWPLLIEADGYVKERELVDWNDHPEENWVWAPQGRINMHAPESWGRLRFVDVGPTGADDGSTLEEGGDE
ncbi:MAG: carbohydrate-binding family 9-like protein [Gemmatimonadetes bacterium]|nr:carbohydrate-binding family 9-like protein [Gemmatimonadota bacterium]